MLTGGADGSKLGLQVKCYGLDMVAHVGQPRHHPLHQLFPRLEPHLGFRHVLAQSLVHFFGVRQPQSQVILPRLSTHKLLSANLSIDCRVLKLMRELLNHCRHLSQLLRVFVVLGLELMQEHIFLDADHLQIIQQLLHLGTPSPLGYLHVVARTKQEAIDGLDSRLGIHDRRI